jgi:carboxyl-terminal processing protease
MQMNKNKIQIWLPLLLSLSMIVGMYVGFKIHDNIPGRSFFYKEKQRPIQEALDLIQQHYVDEVEMGKLTDTAIQSILEHLDPHTVYIAPYELEQINERIQGSFYGVGIEFDIFNDTLHVLQVMKDGPGNKAGIIAGDKIIRANNQSLTGPKMTADSIRSILKGNRDSQLNIELIRGSQSIKKKVVRDMIAINSIDAAYMTAPGIGYIKINEFTTQTYREFMMALQGLKKQGLAKLVLDLRGNGGGILDEAIDIADEFISGDKLITYTEGRHAPKQEYRCKRPGQFENGPLVVLADEGSASASEVLMGALQDWDRATIVGRPSFGKGLVQQQYDLSNRGALRLTIARYYSPMGRSIQRSYANGSKAYYQEIDDRFSNGKAVGQGSVYADSSKVFTTKAGKKLYGGGGIQPDYFIPADTSLFQPEVLSLYQAGNLIHFAYEFAQQKKGLLNQFKDAKAFGDSFHLQPNHWKQFEQFNLKDSLQLSTWTTNEKVFVEKTIIAHIARMIWGDEAYFISLNNKDAYIEKAIQLLRK